MSASIHDDAYRALEMVDAIPAGCIGVIVTREDFEPHLHHGEVAIVDTADREPQHGELYAIEVHQHRGGRAAASLAVVQAYRRDGDLWCRYAFKVPGEAREKAPLSDGPFAPAGWTAKCAGRVVAVMRPVWQATDHRS